MSPRDRALLVTAAFLAGIGATALVAYVATVEERRHARAEDADRAAQNEMALYRGRENNDVHKKAEGHIRALLGASVLSSQKKDAAVWLAKYGSPQ